MPELDTKLVDLFEPVAAGCGLELVAVELDGPSGAQVLRVTVDRPGGVSVDDCVAVSREISTLLDVEDPLPGRYRLEVSSPGVERPLRKRQDFERFAGEEVAIRYTVGDRTRRVAGRLAGIDATDQVLVDTGQGGVARVDFAAVEKAHLVFRFGRGKGRSRRRT